MKYLVTYEYMDTTMIVAVFDVKSDAINYCVKGGFEDYMILEIPYNPIVEEREK